MSTCLSRHGEYSEHIAGQGSALFICPRCHGWDEAAAQRLLDGVLARLAVAREVRDTYTRSAVFHRDDRSSYRNGKRSRAAVDRYFSYWGKALGASHEVDVLTDALGFDRDGWAFPADPADAIGADEAVTVRGVETVIP